VTGKEPEPITRLELERRLAHLALAPIRFR
jgi:hypothetical protein